MHLAGKFLRTSFVVSFLLVVSSTSPAQQSPEHVTAAVDEVFSDVANPGSPGCALAVAREGKLLYAKGYGLANIEQNVPVTPDSVFDIGSTSKQFSASSILLLEKQGKLSVNDDARKYIPELPSYGKRITILNLLNHTSGLRDYLALFELSGVNVDNVTTDEEALALVVRQRGLDFDPGSEWLYSNTGFFLLSTIVKRVSGQSLREFAAANIFQPLAMTHTVYRDSHTLLIPNRALAYDPVEKSSSFTLDVSYFEQTGDGAVHTTVGDLLKWDENFYTAQVGGKPFLAELQAPGTLTNGKTLNYAKGLFIGPYRGLPTVRHGGSWGGYRAELLRFPEQHFSVVCLCNRSDSNPENRAERVADIYLASLLKPKEPKKEDRDDVKKKPEFPVSSEDLKALPGFYWSDELAVTYKLDLSDGKLALIQLLGTGGMPRSSDLTNTILVPVAKDEFDAGQAGATFHFQRDASGIPVSFTLDVGRSKGMIFKRVSGNQ
jgi:CubicO group peptidase (beta-lactamase class C family)